jgi:TRAP-type C4-dicarboxylate transport system substrate-binding protein
MPNETNSRRIAFYPNTLFHKLTTAYAFDNILSKSEAEKEINKKFFNSLSKDEKDKYIKIYDEMTDEQRKRPHKNNPNNDRP